MEKRTPSELFGHDSEFRIAIENLKEGDPEADPLFVDYTKRRGEGPCQPERPPFDPNRYQERTIPPGFLEAIRVAEKIDQMQAQAASTPRPSRLEQQKSAPGAASSKPATVERTAHPTVPALPHLDRRNPATPLWLRTVRRTGLLGLKVLIAGVSCYAALIGLALLQKPEEPRPDPALPSAEAAISPGAPSTSQPAPPLQQPAVASASTSSEVPPRAQQKKSITRSPALPAASAPKPLRTSPPRSSRPHDQQEAERAPETKIDWGL